MKMAVLQEGTTNIPQQAFVQWNDPHGEELVAINRDGTIYCQGISIAGQYLVPIVQGTLTAVDVTTAQSVTTTASTTVMYSVSVYMESKGGGGSGHVVTCSITYTSPDGVHSNVVLMTLTLDTAEVVIETYPLLAQAGSAITLQTTYGGAYADAYTVSARIVQMP
jgi:hypothetical protein